MIQINAITIFFYIVIFTLILMIIYFNIIAGKKYSKSMVIDIKNNSSVCKYSSLPLLNKNNQCNDGSYYYQSPGGNYYILGKKPIFYHTVCKSLCGGATGINGQCGQENPAGFNICLADLQPQEGCKNTAVPLMEDEEKIYYYAQSVNINIPCKI